MRHKHQSSMFRALMSCALHLLTFSDDENIVFQNIQNYFIHTCGLCVVDTKTAF